MASTRYRYDIACMVLCLLIATGCSKQREIAPEEKGTPNVAPREQLLFRDARDVIHAWLKDFSSTKASTLFSYLSWRSRDNLKKLGRRDAQAFEAWFQDRKRAAQPPFIYRFSRMDILDVDIRDTNRAIITASLLVESQGQEFETVSSFFLVRERGAWKIPFMESEDNISSWWQQEKNFNTRARDEGMSAYLSRPLQLSLSYPTLWDVREGVELHVPGTQARPRGLEISYLDPGTQQKEAIVRIYGTEGSGEVNQDTLIPQSLRTIHTEDASLVDGFLFSGKTYRLANSDGRRVYYVFTAVNTSLSQYSNYSGVLTRIVESIEPLSNR